MDVDTIIMKENLFEEKNIAPMLIKEQRQDPDFIFELKFEGLRCIAYLDPEKGTDLRNKKDIPLLKLYPELKELHHHVENRCILDGELVLFENGVPNFYKMQKRSIMKDPFKIQITAKLWLEPHIVCIITYMYETKKGALRQPVLKGFHNDKHPLECKIIDP